MSPSVVGSHTAWNHPGQELPKGSKAQCAVRGCADTPGCMVCSCAATQLCGPDVRSNGSVERRNTGLAVIGWTSDIVRAAVSGSCWLVEVGAEVWWSAL